MRYHGMSLKDWYYEVRHQVRRAYSFFVRGYYGVAPMDTWSLDRHTFAVLARGMRILAKDPHGVPMFIAEEYNLETDENGGPLNVDQAVECWQDWLTKNAEWLEWYLADEIGLHENMTELEKVVAINAYDKKYETFKTIILPGIVKNIDALWD